MVHFSWEITLGQVVVSVPISVMLYYIARIWQMLLMFRIEHEYLMQDYAVRNNLQLKDLPTRQKKWW